MRNWFFIIQPKCRENEKLVIYKQTGQFVIQQINKHGRLKIQKRVKMVIYLTWSQQVATWPIFPLIFHNDLQTISNMASSTSFTFLFSLSFTFFHPHFPSFTFIFLRTPSFAFINLHSPSFILIHLHSNSFTFIHTHPSSLIFIYLNRPTVIYFRCHDSPEIIQRIVAPSQYSFLINLFPCPLVFRHYTYSKKILHFRETYRILHCFVMKQGLNEVYILPTDLTFWP